jgi:hypothetical protein
MTVVEKMVAETELKKVAVALVEVDWVRAPLATAVAEDSAREAPVQAEAAATAQAAAEGTDPEAAATVEASPVGRPACSAAAGSAAASGSRRRRLLAWRMCSAGSPAAIGPTLQCASSKN